MAIQYIMHITVRDAPRGLGGSNNPPLAVCGRRLRYRTTSEPSVTPPKTATRFCGAAPTLLNAEFRMENAESSHRNRLLDI